MNCKPGDLAVMVYSTCGNEGKIVRCEVYIGDVLALWPDGTERTLVDAWRLDQPVRGFDGRFTNLTPDAWLRPIRDNDGEDETLQWAPVPHKEVA